MIIINSKSNVKTKANTYSNTPQVEQFNSCSSRASNSLNHFNSSNKQKQQKLIIDWIHKQFGTFPQSRKLSKIQELRSGAVLAEILYNLLPSQITQQQNFLQSIVINNLNQSDCINNLSKICSLVQKYFKNIDLKYDLHLNLFTKPEQIYANVELMKMFFTQVIIKISQIDKNQLKSTGCLKKVKQNFHQDKDQKKQNNSQSKYFTYEAKRSEIAGISDLSQIANLQNLQIENKTAQKYQSCQLKNNRTKSLNKRLNTQYDNQQNYMYKIQEKNSKQKQFMTRDEVYLRQQRQNKICQLLDWMHDTYNLPIEDLQAHQLLGKLANCILGNSRLNQQVIKPVHFQMGSACVYRKVVDAFLKCQRINKSNLIQMSCDIQNGVVNEEVYWKVIQDIWCLVNNKISFIQTYSSNLAQKFKSQQKLNTIQQEQKQNNPIAENQNLQIINYKVHQNQKIKQNTKLTKPSHPVYDKETIIKAQKWLQDMGFSYSLSKSKTIKLIKMNPLLNGTLMGSLIIRLKIGKINLIKQPKNMKQTLKNIEQVKIALMMRGYQCGRKLDQFKPGMNFYLGLIAQIRSLYEQKQSRKKESIADNIRYKRQCKDIYKIYNKEKQEVLDWLTKQFSMKLEFQQQIQVAIIFEVFQACINSTLLRETTQKIIQININRILEELRNIGLSQYYTIKISDILGKDSQVKNDIKWMILRDLKSLICGTRGFVQYST